MRINSSLSFWIIACGLALSSGCGPRMGTISGEATYKGKAIPGGLLTFRPKDNSFNSVTYELGRDGKFNLEIPAGEATICIDNREFEPRPPTMPAIPPGMNLPPDVVKGMQASSKETSKVSDRWVKLPEKYYQLETSDLKVEIKGGAQTLNVEFKD
ncbi:MAG: hypothetical protein ABL921_27730 [Pirellula sp.]